MRIQTTAKYGFRIRTRSGAVVDNLLIFGRDASDAERKIRQIYRGCEIMSVTVLPATTAYTTPVTYEEVIDLITGGNDGFSAVPRRH